MNVPKPVVSKTVAFIIKYIRIMWQVALVAAITIVITTITIAASLVRNKRSNYRGTQVGGDEHTPFFDSAKDKAGMLGEKTVNLHLRSLLKEDEYLLANLLLPLKNGHKTEIDCVLISRRGIFCIETKNWVGHISGNDDDEYWHQWYDDPRKRSRDHRNPVKQNEAHCDILERRLHNNYLVHNNVIFADLYDGTGIESDYAFTVESFKDYYQELSDTELKPSQIKAVFEMLLPCVASADELAKHKKEYQQLYS